MPWKKGTSGNPRGRQSAILPEVKSLVDQNKNILKANILRLLSLSTQSFMEVHRSPPTMMESLLCQCIERIQNDGDALKLRMLLEIALGKLPEESHQEGLREDEKAVLSEYNRRLDQRQDKIAGSA
jgi:hypothetical protein